MARDGQLRCPRCGDSRVDVKHESDFELWFDGTQMHFEDTQAIYSCAGELCHTVWVEIEHWREDP